MFGTLQLRQSLAQHCISRPMLPYNEHLCAHVQVCTCDHPLTCQLCTFLMRSNLAQAQACAHMVCIMQQMLVQPLTEHTSAAIYTN